MVWDATFDTCVSRVPQSPQKRPSFGGWGAGGSEEGEALASPLDSSSEQHLSGHQEGEVRGYMRDLESGDAQHDAALDDVGEASEGGLLGSCTIDFTRFHHLVSAPPCAFDDCVPSHI